MTSDAHLQQDGEPLNGECSADMTGKGRDVTIAEEASRVRALLLGDSRSTTLANLFDYLLKRSGDARPPKEIEVAIAVFGKNGTFDTSENSTVRSHIHRLRQRLDRFNAGKSGLRFSIPKGEYRLILSEAPEHGEEEAPPTAASATFSKRVPSMRTVAIVLGTNALLWATVLHFRHDLHSSSSLAQTPFWQPILAKERAPVIAVGDFFLVGKSGSSGKLERLVMNPKINSGTDLANYLSKNPGLNGKLHDRDLYRVPASEAKCATAILAMVSAMRPDEDVAEIIPVSRISQDRFDSNNIIYIQYFSQLAKLRSPILHLTGFVPTDDFNEIRDVASGQRYRARYAASESASSGEDLVAAHSYTYDYGYIASFPGPSSNHNILISGIGDVGLSQMVKLVSDERQLDTLAKRTKGASAFEALYQIRAIGGLVFDTKLLLARPLKQDAVKDLMR